jgi:Fe-S cluster biogenesis protein NfuA
VGCPSSQMTLKMGVERNLQQRVPEVTEVICV